LLGQHSPDYSLQQAELREAEKSPRSHYANIFSAVIGRSRTRMPVA
jgi:hypothetical protein